MATQPPVPDARVQRPWLKRVGNYVPGRRKAKGEPGTGDEQAFGEDADGEPQEIDGEPGHGEGEQAAPGDGEPTDAPAEETPGLSVPPEVEAKQEEERKRRAEGLNRHLAPKAFDLEGRYLRALAARFARMVSKVAEDSADMPTLGDDEWDLEELRMRRFTGRQVSQCRMTREKRKVAVVLDTSPSCEHQARLFGAVAQVAEALGDCELYDAPNFAISAHKLDDEWETLPDVEREWRFRKRVVLAFGDFDGIDRISTASQLRGNKIYWFCCEERPSVLESSRDYFLKNYKGFYFPTTNLNRLMHAMRRVR